MASGGELKGLYAVHVPEQELICPDTCEIMSISVGQYKSIGK